MRARYRDLTEKYKSFRVKADSLYSSRIMQTFFNKSIKKGKKALARRHLFRALRQLRYTVRYPDTFNVLTGILLSLRIQFLLVPKRQGNAVMDVPVPVRRNKRDVLNIQTFHNAMTRRRERCLYERFEQELLALTIDRPQSSTFRQRNILMARVYEERVNMDKR